MNVAGILVTVLTVLLFHFVSRKRHPQQSCLPYECNIYSTMKVFFFKNCQLIYVMFSSFVHVNDVFNLLVSRLQLPFVTTFPNKYDRNRQHAQMSEKSRSLTFLRS